MVNVTAVAHNRVVHGGEAMITGARRKSLSLAGLMYAKVNALQAVRHRGNLSKPVTLRATDSGVQNAAEFQDNYARG